MTNNTTSDNQIYHAPNYLVWEIVLLFLCVGFFIMMTHEFVAFWQDFFIHETRFSRARKAIVPIYFGTLFVCVILLHEIFFRARSIELNGKTLRIKTRLQTQQIDLSRVHEFVITQKVLKAKNVPDPKKQVYYVDLIDENSKEFNLRLVGVAGSEFQSRLRSFETKEMKL